MKKIVFTKNFSSALQSIIRYISKDKVSAARDFKQGLDNVFDLLKSNPFMGYEIKDKSIRKTVYKGYTVVYEVEPNTLKILDIFKWQLKEEQ